MSDFTVEQEATLGEAVRSRFQELSNRQLKRLFKADAIRADRRRVEALEQRIPSGVQISIDFSCLDERDEASRAILAAKRHDVSELYSDDQVAVFRKPAGLGSTPGFYGDALCFSRYVGEVLHTETLPDEGLLHRLDHGTSGACVFARHRDAHSKLLAQRDNHSLQRTYWAIVPAGVDTSLSITHPIAHHPTHATRMVVVPEDEDVEHRSTPQPATTFVTKLAEVDGAALIEARIEGGRRHQIRVHLAHAGFPLFGDRTYRGQVHNYFPDRLALHAKTVRWLDLEDGTAREASAPCGAHFWQFAPGLER